ncbi:MAG: MFS transporter [SAR324 cluster bacterium]|nr:MFS transporter [SAR324 cluster bacterium]
MDRVNRYRNIIILALCQAMGITGNIIIFSVSALAALEIAPTKALATLPLFLQYATATITTIPASFFMKRFGRKLGFVLGSSMASLGGGIAFLGLRTGNFPLFCLGSALIGVLIGYIPYYRFAAIDTASESFKSIALSLVLAGGVLAAVAGPSLADLSKDLFSTMYAGNFFMLILLPFVTITLLQFVKIPPPAEERSEAARSLRDIIRQPKFLLALCGGMIGYGVMSLLMVATPLSMKHSNLSFSNITLVIQWHVLGMYIPSFFTGSLIKWFGVYKILIAGALSNLLCVAINLSGTSLHHYWAALFLLGIGWNFLFISASSLLTECYRETEKALVQSMNEFLILLTVSVSSLSSGVLMGLFGWRTVNLLVLTPIVLILAVAVWLMLQFNKKRLASEVPI